MNQQNKQILFNNQVINKRQLKNLMYQVFHNYGVVKSSIIADKIKNLTFHYATKSGISLSIEDLKVPNRKSPLIGLTNNEVEVTEQNYNIVGLGKYLKFMLNENDSLTYFGILFKSVICGILFYIINKFI